MIDVALAAPSRLSAEAAALVRNRGGSAVDTAIAAAIAAMFTEIGVAAPGAGAFITVSAPGRSPIVYDGYMAIPGLHGEQPDPVQYTAVMEYGGGLTTIVGPASIAVPGAWAAFAGAHRSLGNVDFADIVAPTIDLLEGGFQLGRSCLYYLAYSTDVVFGHDEASRRVLQPNGIPVTADDRIFMPDAIDSLRRIGSEGACSVLSGDFGLEMAASLWDRGSLVGPEDFSQYEVVERSPLEFEFGGWTIHTNPAPAVGGPGLVALLSSMAGSRDGRRFIAAQERLFRWRRGPLHMSADRQTDIEQFLNELPGDPIRSPSTVHISAVDSDGVACSITLSAGYGSGVIPGGTGMYMNNGIGELELIGEKSTLVPGERLNSNMAPSVLLSSSGSTIAIGSPGADRISSALASVISSLVIDEMQLEAALLEPRLHVAVDEDGSAVLMVEPGADIPECELPVVRFDGLNMYFGGVGVAAISADGRLSAAADPRRPGVATILRDREN